MGSPTHLLRRFVGSLRCGGPSEADRRWAMENLLPTEEDLWDRLSAADQRHAVAVARAAVKRLDEIEIERPVVAAALLHDVGKLESGLGTIGRVVATLVSMAVSSSTVASWSGVPGFRHQVAVYLRHPEEGAAVLLSAGSDPLTVSWAAEHHQKADAWTVERLIGEALAEADKDWGCP
ncbi:MAG: HDIG domain-containing metalloprotein [Actinomycetota bacterium]|nr:HDIG domain-containing metalloprotein [Actinomycetota bacterium]